MLQCSRSVESLWRGLFFAWKNWLWSDGRWGLVCSMEHMGIERHSHKGYCSMISAHGTLDKSWVKSLQPGLRKRREWNTSQESQKGLHKTLQSRYLLAVTSLRTRPKESCYPLRAEGTGEKSAVIHFSLPHLADLSVPHLQFLLLVGVS